ncbi:LamG domain-containing protein [Halioxenophilus aromaticivorans]|uniref:LamG-like jellyroll fold domain-containing protein n=1 Tax=Halioxenophilus aromaticivorans TaxID=1306992 RepID=A0AAV3U252_9ALTE
MRHPFAGLVALVSVLLLAGCGGGGGGGAATVANQDTSNDAIAEVVYSGPNPTTTDVQNYKTYVWDNLNSGERCGACHTNQAPSFLRSDDINQAYAQANALVDLNIPGDSRLVTKVAEGHNCWESVSSVCADIITGFIESWAAASGSVSNTITLTDPLLKDVGDSKNFPQDALDFETTVYPMLNTYCAGCHSEEAATGQQPFIGSSDVAVAYEAAKTRIDLTTPGNSRLVLRLRNEFHNCWTDCIENADALQLAIAEFSAQVPVTSVNPELVISRAMELYDGVTASSGGRVESNAVAIWDFSTGEGSVAYDKTGIEPALNLSLSGDVQWLGAYGLSFGPGGRAQALTADSGKLYDMIASTGEFSLEAWVVPANVSQEGPARIVSYSGAADSRNFMLGQTLYNYDFYTRSSVSDANGSPGLSTLDDDEVLQATLQHVVATFHPVSGRKLYVNGELVAEDATVGNFNAWDSSFALVLGAEVDGQYGWEGLIRFLAVYNRAMSEEDVATNFDAGVGERYYLMFNIEEHVDVPRAYVVFEVSQFDDYAYLFAEPFFISLDANANIGNINLEGMYLGVNGRESPVGQAFSNLSVNITDASYQPGIGQPLSAAGTLVPLEFGPGEDQFFLSFDRLANNQYSRPEAEAPALAEQADQEPAPDIGFKNFAEINETLAAITQVPITDARVAATFSTIEQQLPSVENINSFLSSHQMAVTQLAVAYCNAMVTDAGAGLPSRDGLIDSLLTAMLANGLAGNGGATIASQPDPDQPDESAANSVRDELANLHDRISAASGTSAAAIATCAAAAGSALATLQ